MTSPLPRISPADYEWLPDDDSHRVGDNARHDDAFVAAVAAKPFMPWTPKPLDADLIRGAVQAVAAHADTEVGGAVTLTAEARAHLQALRSRSAMSMRDFIALASLTSRDIVTMA